jgi:Ca2+-binding RTX toxin-like protein
MAIINATNPNETLFGTSDDDVLNPFNGNHLLFGGAGADIYNLRKAGYSAGSSPVNTYIIDEKDTDISMDTITISGVGSGLVTFRNFYKYSTFTRVGDDLVAVIPGQTSWFHHPGSGAVNLTITNQFSDAHPEAAIEILVAGGISYNLARANAGTSLNDIVTGGDGDDVIYTYAGADYICANGGNDNIHSGSGGDIVFAGAGDDYVSGKSGDDKIFGEDGNDEIHGGTGNDQVDGGLGDDKLYGFDGNDWLLGGDGNDYLSGGKGDDVLAGGSGNNVLRGGYGVDAYSFNDGAGTTQTIIDYAGETDSGQDRVNIIASSAASFMDLNYARIGNNLVITTPVGGVITFKGQYYTASETANHAIEFLSFENGGWDGSLLLAKTLTDESEATVDGVGPSMALIFGGTGNEEISGGKGVDIIFGGGGADVFIIDNESSIDQIRDFSISDDHIDFSGIGGAGLSLGDLEITETNTNGVVHTIITAPSSEAPDFIVDLFGFYVTDITDRMFIF